MSDRMLEKATYICGFVLGFTSMGIATDRANFMIYWLLTLPALLALAACVVETRQRKKRKS